jgi:uncharacterized protein (DUF1800 family)
MANVTTSPSAAMASPFGATPITSPTIKPAVTAPAAPAMSAASAARFLLQAQFSASDADIAAVQSQGFMPWLINQINAPNSVSSWDWLMQQGVNSAANLNATLPLDHTMWHQLITSSDTVRKRVALALSEFFVVSINGVSIQSRAFAVARYWDVLVAGAFGNFRTLLEEITLNPAMGAYLNTKGNKKANLATGSAPDENYAREVMQLFTVGLYQLNLDGTNKLVGGAPVETYHQADVSNLAMVMTGWDFDTTGNVPITNPLSVKNRMRLNPALHETAAATFLGTTIPAGTNGVTALGLALDALFKHPNVAPFFCKQLIQRLVTSNPSAAYVTRVATVFNNNGKGVRGDLAAVVKAVLLDAEARDDSKVTSNTWGKQREPMLRFVQWARSFNATSNTGQWAVGDLSNAATQLGQSPLRSPTVFNYFRPGYVPTNSGLAAQNLMAPEFQLTNESSVAGYVNFLTSTLRYGNNSANGGLAIPTYTAELALVSNPAGLVSRLNLLLCAGQLSVATQSSIQSAIASMSISTAANQLNRVCAAILMVMASPEYLIQK